MFCHYESETLAKGSELAVYQCRHGLLHLRVNRVTLTLKPEEFSSAGDARLRSPDPAAYTRGRPRVRHALTGAGD